MNQKFQRLRGEVLAGLGREDPDDLPPIEHEGLDPEALGDLQVRLYHLWERLKHFRPEALDASEAREREILADHLQDCLTALHHTPG